MSVRTVTLDEFESMPLPQLEARADTEVKAWVDDYLRQYARELERWITEYRATDAAPWEEQRHPRAGAGQATGGQFTRGGSSGTSGGEKRTGVAPMGVMPPPLAQPKSIFASKQPGRAVKHGSKNPLHQAAVARHEQMKQARAQIEAATGAKPQEFGGKLGETIKSFAQRRELRKSVHEIADKMDFPRNKVVVERGRGREFELDGKKFRASAEADPSTGTIHFYAESFKENDADWVKGVAAHEITHQMYWACLDNEQASEALSKYHRDYATVERLEKDDGVTAYSKEYWKTYAKGGVSRESAIHETLAEIARMRQMGKKVPVSPIWNEFFDAVTTEYRKTRGAR